MFQRFVVSVFFAVLAVPSFARDVLVPVVTGTAGNRSFRTTIAATNRANTAAECVFTYRSTGKSDHPLISRETIAAGQARIYEDFLVEMSAAGTIRVDCTTDVELVTRLQEFSDGGKTFRSGRLFRPFPDDHLIKEGTPGTTRAAADVAIAEVAGKPVHVEVSAANFGGVEYAHAAYDVPPYALRIISLADVLVKLPATEVTVTVSGKGAIVIGKETREPALANVALPRTEAQKASQVVAMSAPPSSRVIAMLGISSFKAATFVEPMTGNIYMRDRWYNPQTGRFLSPDPEGYASGANLYSYCHGDPVNCSDPTGRRAMTAEDKRQLAALKARGKKLHNDFMSAGRAGFNQYLLVPVDHSWSDTSGVVGGDYAQQLVPSMVTTQSAYEASRRAMVSDVLTFEAAVARADEKGQIYYNAGIGFTTITVADRQRADRATMVAAGVFFATDEVPMMLSPYAMRGQVPALSAPIPVSRATIPAGVRYEGLAYRFVDPDNVSGGWDIHAANIAASHRYSDVGRGGLYAATSLEGMTGEMAHYGRTMRNATTLGTRISVENVLDLTDPAVRNQLGVTLGQLTGSDYTMTHALGDFARTRYNGILVPSATAPGQKHLVLFRR
ncbi:MAG: RES domain-containing protein [Acidobacteria bacterium]|nr:RES domain-containing protein [Acidobacteriota bacterium]